MNYLLLLAASLSFGLFCVVMLIGLIGKGMKRGERKAALASLALTLILGTAYWWSN